MGKCKYIINIPGGDPVEILAGFETVSKNESIDTLYSQYFSETNEENKKKLFSALSELLRPLVPESIHTNKINAIIKNSVEVEDIYTELNNIINNLGSYEDIEAAIKKHIYADKKWGSANKAAADLKQKLNKPRNKKYFENFGVKSVIGTTSLKQEKDRVFFLDSEHKWFGYSTNLTSNLNNFLNALIHKYPKLAKSNTLYGTKDEFIGKAWTTDDVVVYQLGDDLSLFLGLFKREAVKMNPKELTPLLINLNNSLKLKKSKQINFDTFDIKEFFAGKVENGKIITSKFEQMLELGKDKKIAKDLNAIMNLLAKTIDPNRVGLAKSIKTLFWQLQPESYGKNNLFKELEDIKFTDQEIALGLDFKNSSLSFTEMQEKQRDRYYAPNETITHHVYENALKNITVNKDIVKFPLENGKDVFALATHILQKDDKIRIYGIYKTSWGELKTLHADFEGGDLVYRKYEDIIAPYVDTEEIPDLEEDAGTLIVSEDDMDHKLIKQFIQKGDLINGLKVVGIYAKFLTLQSPKSKKLSTNWYQHIKSVYSVKAKETIEKETTIKPNEYVQIKNGEDLEIGDYFLYEEGNSKFYKQVLYTDEENVYSWLPGTKEKTYVIKATKRAGLKGLRSAEDAMSSEEFKRIENEISLIGRTATTMSSFKDKNKAQYGDYFYFLDGTVHKQGKVLKNNKVLIYGGNLSNRTVESIDKLKDPTFFTDRDISSVYGMFQIRVNSINVEFKKEAEPLEFELKYVVPEGTNIDDLTLLSSNYGNIGTYKEKAYIKKGEKDVTEEFLQKKLGITGKKVFGKALEIKNKKAPKIWERNLTSLVEMEYFNTLEPDIKEELEVINPGVYFSLFLKGNTEDRTSIDRNIYRVMSVEGDVVTAHLTKLSNGKIITTEQIFSKEELIKSTGEKGSIAKFYLQTGNNKIRTTFNEINKNYKGEGAQKINNKAINTLIGKLKNYVGGLDIKIKLVSPKGNFKIGEKAKIETTSDGKTVILINNEIGQTEDVIHEFLHLFLTPLRYKQPEIYNALISSIVEDPNLDVTAAEEVFVKIISAKMQAKEDFLEDPSDFKNLQSFVKGIKAIILDINPEFKLDFDLSTEENPVTLLNTPLMDLFDINSEDDSHLLYDLSMLTTEPLMREWMTKNNIILKCN